MEHPKIDSVERIDNEVLVYFTDNMVSRLSAVEIYRSAVSSETIVRRTRIEQARLD